MNLFMHTHIFRLKKHLFSINIGNNVLFFQETTVGNIANKQPFAGFQKSFGDIMQKFKKCKTDQLNIKLKILYSTHPRKQATNKRDFRNRQTHFCSYNNQMGYYYDHSPSCSIDYSATRVSGQVNVPGNSLIWSALFRRIVNYLCPDLRHPLIEIKQY